MKFIISIFRFSILFCAFLIFGCNSSNALIEIPINISNFGRELDGLNTVVVAVDTVLKNDERVQKWDIKETGNNAFVVKIEFKSLKKSNQKIIENIQNDITEEIRRGL
jgi:ABC-type uncharacterized transport system substrate-binding protein